MHFIRRVAALITTAAVLSLVSVVAASAAQFTASETGEITGKATSAQKLVTGAGTMECASASAVGNLTTIALPELQVTVTYGGCKMLGFIGLEISPAAYQLKANGEVGIAKPITIKIPLGGCSIVFPEQTVKSVNYTNAGTSNITETSHVSGIVSIGSGGLCGSANSSGTFSGNNEFSRVGRGTLRFDP